MKAILFSNIEILADITNISANIFFNLMLNNILGGNWEIQIIGNLSEI